MFTGLIETTCTVKSIRHNVGSMQLTIDLGKLADETKIGDSIAVNGVCLTIARLDGRIASFDVSAETLTKTILDKCKTGSQVNIERALRPTDRLGGHIVLGHVDGTATIKAIKKHNSFADIKFAADAQLLDQIILKGSVAVDGVSLTVADMDENSFSVAIIPKTLEKTTLGRAKIGEIVNIETDIIVKTAQKQQKKALSGQKKLTVEKLKQAGF